MSILVSFKVWITQCCSNRNQYCNLLFCRKPFRHWF